jgi:UDP-GlcNAc:undecaprenyl-phosphate GlcNAc-1-phosphate transferase
MAVMLLAKVNPALSPALPALILGLPIIDILAVFAQRVYGGMNWFRATRNHIHHRLLEHGFDHYEAVVIIYSIQTFFVVSAVLLRYEADWLILSIYLGLCTLIFALIFVAMRTGWRAHQTHAVSRLTRFIDVVKRHRIFITGPGRLVTVAIPLLFVAVAVLADRVPRDLGTGAAVLMAPMLFYLVSRTTRDSILIRVISYVTSAFVIYLETRHIGTRWPILETIGLLYFGMLAVATGLAVRFANDGEFKTSPMDFLVIFFVLSIGILTRIQPGQIELGSMAVKLVILFYGCELIISRLKSRWNLLSIATLAALAVIGVRGLL